MTTKFKGVSNYSDSLTTQQLEANLISFLNWGFLSIGAFQNVIKTGDISYVTESDHTQILTEDSQTILDPRQINYAVGAYGGEPAILRRVSDPNYLDGTVFEGFRKNWIWESNIEYPYQPISISGVYVDGNFIPKNSSGQYAHYIDYPAGRVVFNTPVSGSPEISCEYSFRHIYVDLADSPTFQQVQFNSYRIDDPTFALYGSGGWSVLSQNRIQLPCIVVEPVLTTSRIPYALGDYTVIHSQDCLFTILAETDYDRKQIHDTLVTQQEIVIKGFDKDKLLAASGYPVAYNGALQDNAIMYPDIVNNNSLSWSNIRFKRMSSVEVQSDPPLYLAKCRGTFECYLP